MSETPRDTKNYCHEEAMRLRPPLAGRPTVYAVMGPSGIGKSWMCRQLAGDFEYVGYDEVPHKDFLDILYARAKVSTKPLLVDLLISTGTFIRRSKYLYDVVAVFVVEPEDVHRARLLSRGGEWTPSIGRRRETLKRRADRYAAFRGTQAECLAYLRGVLAANPPSQANPHRS
jgi:hypothetical protein